MSEIILAKSYKSFYQVISFGFLIRIRELHRLKSGGRKHPCESKEKSSLIITKKEEKLLEPGPANCYIFQSCFY